MYIELQGKYVTRVADALNVYVVRRRNDFTHTHTRHDIISPYRQAVPAIRSSLGVLTAPLGHTSMAFHWFGCSQTTECI